MKEKIRVKAVKNRKSLSERERAIKSKKIAELVRSMPEVKRAKCVSTYIGVNSEVKTLGLLAQLLASDKRVAVPRITGSGSMEMYAIESLDELEKKGSFIEPRNEFKRFCEPKKIEAIIVPGLAFDDTGHRVGYGKGYYDTFLKRLSPSTPVIGLAFECQLFEEIPVEEHDVRLGWIVTEKRIINCSISTNLERLAGQAAKPLSKSKKSKIKL